MKRPSQRILDLPLGKRAELALRAAVREAIKDHVEHNVPICILRDGQVVDILPEMRRKLRRKKARK